MQPSPEFAARRRRFIARHPPANVHEIHGLATGIAPRDDAHATEALVLELASDLFGNCANVPVRPAGGDDHEVTDGRLTCQIDRHDLLGFRLVEPMDDVLQQGCRLLSV